jgi:hypothetical protein
MRYWNGIALSIFLFVLMGLISTMAARATDIYGTDCPPDWFQSTTPPPPDCLTPRPPQSPYRLVVTSNTACATSSSNKCCTYRQFNVYCTIGDTFQGNSYGLMSAGEAGKVCVNGACVNP